MEMSRCHLTQRNVSRLYGEDGKFVIEITNEVGRAYSFELRSHSETLLPSMLPAIPLSPCFNEAVRIGDAGYDDCLSRKGKPGSELI